VAFQERSSAGSFARTVHYFRKISGAEFWPGGVAYDSDLSVYPARFRARHRLIFRTIAGAIRPPLVASGPAGAVSNYNKRDRRADREQSRRSDWSG
jgi:hypothetical protein